MAFASQPEQANTGLRESLLDRGGDTFMSNSGIAFACSSAEPDDELRLVVL